MNKSTIAVIFGLLAAVATATVTPFSSLVSGSTGPMTAVGLMNLGVGIVAVCMAFGLRKNKSMMDPARHLRKSDTKALILMNIADFLAVSCLTVGLTMVSSTSASLMLNFEIAATALIALFFLREKISKTLWITIILITLGCITISAGDLDAILSSPGILLVLATCVCWGFSNCLKKQTSERNPTEILIVRGFSVGIAGIIAAIICGEGMPDITSLLFALLSGLICYGVSNYLYILSQRELGAAKAGVILGTYPFISAVLSLIIFHETPTLSFVIALLLLIPGFYLATVTREPQSDAVTPVKKQVFPVVEKVDIRNYLTSFGFVLMFIIGVLSLMSYLYSLTEIRGSEIGMITGCTLAILQIMVGVILIVLRHRDFAGMMSLACGFLTALSLILWQQQIVYLIVGVFYILLGLVVLSSSERKRFYYVPIYLVSGIDAVCFALGGYSVVGIVLEGLLCLYVLYLAIASSSMMPHSRSAQILMEEEHMEFGISGSMIGHLIIGLSLLPWIAGYLFGVDIVPLEVASDISLLCGIYLVILSLLMIFVGKNSFISIVFMGIATALILFGSTTGVTFLIGGILLLIIGLFCILRKRSYLLLAVLCILYGIASFTSTVVYGEVMLLISQFLMHTIAFMIAIYVAFAVFSQKKKLVLF